MSTAEIRSSDMAILLAAIQSSNNTLQVDAEKVAKQLGLRLSSIPPRFTEIRKRYNIHIKVVNAGALQRKKTNEARRLETEVGPDSDPLEKSEVINDDGHFGARTQLACGSHASDGPISDTDVLSPMGDDRSLRF